MIKVAIVDDEAYFRRYLKNAIVWEDYGLEICFEARNGMEALKLAKDNLPDIVLADISMPTMDGLVLAEKLKEISPQIKIIIVTGHSEFEYARRAIRIKVTDYILKPFNEDELIALLIKVKAEIHGNLNGSSDVLMNKDEFRESFLNMLINGAYDIAGQAVKNHFEKLGLLPGMEYFTCAVVEIDNINTLDEKERDIDIWRYAISNILDELIKVDGKYFIFNGSEMRVVMILCFSTKKDADSIDKKCLEHYCEIIKRYFEFTVTIGLGEFIQGFNRISQSYKSAIVALKSKMILGTSCVIDFNDVNKRLSNTGFYPSEINENIIRGLKKFDMTLVQSNIHEALGYIDKLKLSVDCAHIIFVSILSTCFSYIIERGGSILEISGHEINEIAEVSENCTIDQMEEKAVGLFRETIEFFGGRRISSGTKYYNSALQIIENNYSDCSLTVEKIAAMLFIDARYLRKIFQNESDSTVSDYITMYKLKKAKELISNSGLKLSQIALMTGYSDAGYFSKVFKKYYGFSPSEYENMRTDIK